VVPWFAIVVFVTAWPLMLLITSTPVARKCWDNPRMGTGQQYAAENRSVFHYFHPLSARCNAAFSTLWPIELLLLVQLRHARSGH
jgi:hypothetical protein